VTFDPDSYNYWQHAGFALLWHSWSTDLFSVTAELPYSSVNIINRHNIAPG